MRKSAFDRSFADPFESSLDVEQKATLLAELEASVRDWPDDGCAAERRSILDLQRGQLLYRREEYNKALEMYDKAERGLPQDGEALKKQLGKAFEEVGDKLAWEYEGREIKDSLPSTEAEHAFTRAIACGHESASQYHSLGAVQIKLGNLEGSLKSRLKAVSLAPEHVFAWNGLGNVYDDLGCYDDAIAAFQRAIELDPNTSLAYNGLAIVYCDLGRYDDGIAAFQRAIELDPKFAPPHNNLAEIYKRQRRFDDARRELNERIMLEPDNTFAPLILLGVIARHQGLPESEKYFRRALAQWEIIWHKRSQAPAELLVNKAKGLLCLGNKDEAAKVVAEAIANMWSAYAIDFDDYILLQTAPMPPDGVEQMIEILKGAQVRRQER